MPCMRDSTYHLLGTEIGNSLRYSLNLSKSSCVMIRLCGWYFYGSTFNV